MKKPRVKDFDPNAQESEPRKLGSPMDNMPAIGRQHSPQEQAGESSSSRDSGTSTTANTEAYGRTTVREYGRTVQLRELKRHPFELGRDQLAILKRWSLEDQQQGLPGSMSAWAREALDEWIAKKRIERGE